MRFQVLPDFHAGLSCDQLVKRAKVIERDCSAWGVEVLHWALKRSAAVFLRAAHAVKV